VTEPAADGPVVVREDDGAVATLWLNRPAKRNALSVAVFAEIERHLDDLEQQTETIGLVLLRGRGPVFSAGADISKPDKKPRNNFQASVVERLAHLPQPLVAVVHGICYTGGLELALTADLIVASEQARFSDTHGKWSLTAGWGMSQRLPRRIGVYKAREMSLTARQYDGRQAEAMGLVNICVPAEELETAVADLARDILANSWYSNREHKKLYLATDGMRLNDGLAYELMRKPGTGPDFADRVSGRFGNPAK
jgi:enoyl-CoA hydratase/carnithine racemase